MNQLFPFKLNLFLVYFSDKETIKSAVMEVLDERESQKKEKTLVISKVSASAVQSLLRRLSISLIDGSEDVPVVSQAFEVFHWRGDSENEGTAAALLHLQTELEKFGCRFGSEGYKFVDVHSYHGFLNFSDKRIGKISGGCDLAIVPHKTADEGAAGQSVVLFELKTDGNVTANGLYSFSNQAKLELIAAYGLSNQKVLVVLTDLASSALVYELVFVATSQSFQLIQYTVNLSQMAHLVATYLSIKAIPNAGYVAMEEDENGVDKVMFKRLKMSNEENLAWENFVDFGSSLPPGSSERCYLVSQLMSSFHAERDYPPINNYSHMYA